MNRSGLRRQVPIPASATTIKLPSADLHFAAGLNTNTDNDSVTVEQWTYVTDARENVVGNWQTRLGTDLFSIPIGETVNVQQTSVTGASTFSFSTTTWWAKKVTAGSTGRLTALEANVKNPGTATGTVVLALFSDNSGTPGTELFRTTLASSAISSSLAYVKGRSISCPDITTGTAYWVVGFVQDGGTNSYQVSTTTAATTAKTSTNSGQSWSTTSFDINVKLSTATAKPVKGHIRVKRPNGSTVTFVAVDTTLYTVNETTGATTSVDTGLDSTATYVRFAYVNDTLYYVQGTTKPRKYDFTTASLVTNAPENAANLFVHKGLIFYQSAGDPNKTYFTNFGLYDTFTSTDFIYVDSPKTGDPQKALARLNGVLYLITRNNKYALLGSQNADFQLQNAVGQKGTFSQESVCYDEDYIFLATDEGIYQFNGAQEVNIAESVLDWWTGLLNKSNTVLELHNNRLYVFYTPNGQSQNTNCKVYNTLYKIWESDDTNTYVQHTCTRFDTDNLFIIGSNRVGMLMLQEQPTNDHTNMGEPLTFELRTSYNPSPVPLRRRMLPIPSAAYKRAAMFRPHFDTVTGSYSIKVGWAFDFSDSPQYVTVLLAGTGPRFDQGYTFDSGVRFGAQSTVYPLDTLNIPGEWRRLQIRYQHYGAREPVDFDGHVLAIEIQRTI